MTLTQQLAAALAMMPCRCTSQWRRPTSDNDSEREVTAQCSRCAAMARYEAEYVAELDTLL